MSVRRTQDRYRDADGKAWKWTRKGWRVVRGGASKEPRIMLTSYRGNAATAWRIAPCHSRPHNNTPALRAHLLGEDAA